MIHETYARVECELAGKKLILETGQIARQAHGSALVTYGETQCFAAACAGPAPEEGDFFPLTVDYREKTDSAGKIPGGFFKREGRPTTKEILTMRLIDRSIRPMFPEGFRQEVQVMSRVFGYDGEHAADILAMIASFAALHVSNIPFAGALGAIRIGKLDGAFSVMPSDARRREESLLDLVVAGHQEAIVMVEASAHEIPEDRMIDALELAHGEIQKICAAIEDLRKQAGKEKLAFAAPEADRSLESAVGRFGERMREAMGTSGKQERAAALDAVGEECLVSLTASIQDEDERATRTKAVKKALGDLAYKVEREMILDGRRVDGRKHDEIRAITIVPDFIARQHGSALFTRGETQALVSCTLGTPARRGPAGA
jgi:polyribonucleotide nucleotidyltransferase